MHSYYMRETRVLTIMVDKKERERERESEAARLA